MKSGSATVNMSEVEAMKIFVVLGMFLLSSGCGVPAMVPPTKVDSGTTTKVGQENKVENACIALIRVCHSKSCLSECKQLLVGAQDDPENLHVYIDGQLQDRNTYMIEDGYFTFVGQACRRQASGIVQSIDVVQGCSGVSPMPKLAGHESNKVSQ